MSSNETKLLLWSGAAVNGFGILWSFPIVNVASAIPAIAGLILVVTRLGYLRAILLSISALALAVLVGYAIKGIELAVFGAIMISVVVILPGLAMGVAARAFSTPIRTVLFGCAPILLIVAMSLIFYSNLDTITNDIVRNFNATMVTYFDDNPGMSTLLMQRYGSEGDAREKFLDETDKFITFLVSVMPGFMIFGFISIVIIGLMLAGRMALPLGIMIPKLRPYYLWKASEWWLLPTCAGLILIFIGGDFGKYLGYNALVVTGHVYAFAGLAYVESFLRRISAPLIIRIAVYILLLLGSLPSLIFMAILGLLDSRFSFRRENAEPGENNLE
jgi:hypothetical protein